MLSSGGSEPAQGGKKNHLWIVDYGAAAADPLAAGPVPVSGLARGAAEPVGLMPAQQSLSLQERPTSEPGNGPETTEFLFLLASWTGRGTRTADLGHQLGRRSR